MTFSDPVTGFGESDITLGGTAGATTAEVSGSGAQYMVSVSGMSASGTVTANIVANGAFDAAGNGNTASTSQDNSVVYAPLVFGSGPTANPMPGLVGAPVQFAVSVNYIATIAWNFGDGSLATGASVNHAFLALGVYNVTVTATHANGQTVTASLSVQVVRSDAPTRDTDGDGILTSMDIDSDGDGFPRRNRGGCRHRFTQRR